MNYLKTFFLKAIDIEDTANEFFKIVEKKGHRVMHTQFYFDDDSCIAVFTVNDEPHPHRFTFDDKVVKIPLCKKCKREPGGTVYFSPCPIHE